VADRSTAAWKHGPVVISAGVVGGLALLLALAAAAAFLFLYAATFARASSADQLCGANESASWAACVGMCLYGRDFDFEPSSSAAACLCSLAAFLALLILEKIDIEAVYCSEQARDCSMLPSHNGRLDCRTDEKKSSWVG
jgi:hypothetical protein